MNGALCRHCGRHSDWWRHEWHHLQGINLPISVLTRARRHNLIWGTGVPRSMSVLGKNAGSESSHGQSAAGARRGRQGRWAAQEVDCVIFGVGGSRARRMPEEDQRAGKDSWAHAMPKAGAARAGIRRTGPCGGRVERAFRVTRVTLPSHSCAQRLPISPCPRLHPSPASGRRATPNTTQTTPCVVQSRHF